MNKSEVWGLPTGFPALDRATGGLQKRDLILIAGRPNMGKTLAAAQMAFDQARHFRDTGSDLAVYFFEGEMEAEQLMLREVSRQTGVPVITIRSGMFDDFDAIKIQECLQELEDLPIIINDESSLSTSEVKKFIDSTIDKFNLKPGAIYYDYINNVGDSGDNDWVIVSKATQKFRQFAKHYNCPMVLLAQLRRPKDDKNDYPKLSELKDSGKLEERSDLVIFIHRESEMFKLNGGELRPTAASFIIAKGRNSATGEIDMVFDPNTVEFKDADSTL